MPHREQAAVLPRDCRRNGAAEQTPADDSFDWFDGITDPTGGRVEARRRP
jgi:hypothetical protein